MWQEPRWALFAPKARREQSRQQLQKAIAEGASTTKQWFGLIFPNPCHPPKCSHGQSPIFQSHNCTWTELKDTNIRTKQSCTCIGSERNKAHRNRSHLNTLTLMRPQMLVNVWIHHDGYLCFARALIWDHEIKVGNVRNWRISSTCERCRWQWRWRRRWWRWWWRAKFRR